MRKYITLAVVMLGALQLSFAQQPQNSKNSFIIEQAPIYQTRNVHPIENLLGAKRPSKIRSKRNFDKLLVLLVDFQEDDDPATTGNGKFDLSDGSAYPIPLDSPPRNHQYFSVQLQALQQYYLAVSHGSYDLQYEVFPAPGAGSNAYTLPQEMSYYNPGTEDEELMIARFEEYFQDVFTAADRDPEIYFGDYGHYMIIHAGSDWQHDRNGDSPHDIPSFFIQVGDGKEVVVDDGETIISNACNIPETISQDIREDEMGVFNYGVINSVMVHEFGHSLGFVDLYNTSNFTPGVGYYDIMDAGGNILLGNTFPPDHDIAYYLEGINPIFPGAFSRVIAFEDFYRSSGMLKDISEIPFDQEIKLLPIAKEYDLDQLAENELFILKIPLSATEYILVENRQVDPDGDGGTIPIGGLPNAQGDNRVVLGPSSTSYTDSNFNYEYDWLLPGWMDSADNNFGGGLVVWHVDEELLYQNDNFANNTVNTNYFLRAVKILEADGIDDIANQYSHFWQGTAFDPFYKYMPIIDERNFFRGWDDKYVTNPDGSLEFVGNLAAPELSAASDPALQTNDGTPSLYKLYDISSYDINYHEPNSDFEGRKISLKVGTNLFDETQVIELPTEITAVGTPGTNFGFTTLPLAADDFHLWSKPVTEWAENFGAAQELNITADFPIISADLGADGETEYLLTADNELYIYQAESYTVQQYDSQIMAAPLYIEEFDKLVVATVDQLYIGELAVDLSALNLAFDGENLIAITSDQLLLLNAAGDILQAHEIENLSSTYQPVAYRDLDSSYNALFIQDQAGAIWKVQAGKLEKIFELAAYSALAPTNLAIAEIKQDGMPYLIFAAGDRTFALTMDGTLAQDFPGYHEQREFIAGGFPKVVKIDDKIISYFPAQDSYLAIDAAGDFLPEYSWGWQMQAIDDQLFWLAEEKSLNLAYSDGHSLYLASRKNVETNPIFWQGFRNKGAGYYQGARADLVVQGELESYVFPNPVKNGEARIRVNNASSDLELKIYDIAGNKLLQEEFNLENNSYQDLVWDCSEIASGVYFAIIKSGQQSSKLSIAVIK
ncbi:MAG: T9SS type A sorting domain-containing protein [Candidatus Cloacimonadales bacterium]